MSSSTDPTERALRAESPIPGPTLRGQQAGTGGLSADVHSADLNSDPLLTTAPRVQHQGQSLPALGGIPLLHKLGQGGMGAVYYAHHPRLNQEIAVKVLPFQLAAEEIVQRFFREAQLAARVRSPHLIGVLDVNKESGVCYILMEYVAGRSAGAALRDAVEQNGHPGLSELYALEICIAATQGLAAAHLEGVVHRDVKPDNIMIPYVRGERDLDYQNAKLADLGLARGNEVGQSVTGTRAVMGTPGYMPPEQVEDAHAVTAAADVYSMGATLFALLTGHPPYTGGMIKVLRATVDEAPPSIRSIRPEVSLPTAELISRCLAKNPLNRILNGAALLTELKHCRERLLTPAITQKAAVVAPVIATPLPSPVAAIELPLQRRAGPRGRYIALIIIVLLALLIVAGRSIFNRNDVPTSEVYSEIQAALTDAEHVDKASELELQSAIANLEKIHAANSGKLESQAAPLLHTINKLRSRHLALMERRQKFQSHVAESEAKAANDPLVALIELDTAEILGKGDPGQNLPDLNASLRPSLADRRIALQRRKISDDASREIPPKPEPASETAPSISKADNPFVDARVGDYAVYTVTSVLGETTVDMVMTHRISKKIPSEATIEVVTLMNGRETVIYQTVDLRKSYKAVFNPAIEMKEMGRGNEVIKVGGRDYPTQWMDLEGETETEGKRSKIKTRTWISSDVPVGGVVKTVVELENAGTTTMVLNSFDRGMEQR
jgi:hypothetical protein